MIKSNVVNFPKKRSQEKPTEAPVPEELIPPTGYQYNFYMSVADLKLVMFKLIVGRGDTTSLVEEIKQLLEGEDDDTVKLSISDHLVQQLRDKTATTLKDISLEG